MNSHDTPSDDPALASRAEALARREAAVQEREDWVKQVEDLQRAASEGHPDLLSRNADLMLANERLVMATLAADELREEAQRVRARQDEFLAMLAHELRNPLAPIRSSVELLAKTGSEASGRIVEVLRRQVNQMVRLVDDLLDVSRVTHGKVTLQRIPTDVSAFVGQAVESCADLIASRRQQLTVQLPPHEVQVDGDLVRLTQVFTNLLQNASKYTPEEGKIALNVHASGSTVELQVTDSGSGISSEMLPHVFELFIQDKQALNREKGGLGIGLTVARKMVELHGGTVTARSEGPGRGSQFSVVLPRIPEKSTATKIDSSEKIGFSPARILLIEDNIDAGELLAELLQESGHKVEIAPEGTRGLELFDTFLPHVVLCDIGLPGLNGYQVVELMRGRQRLPRPRFVALSGYGTAEDIKRSDSAGFDCHLIKPVDCDDLLVVIDAAKREFDAEARR